jgi:hypothetical protein
LPETLHAGAFWSVAAPRPHVACRSHTGIDALTVVWLLLPLAEAPFSDGVTPNDNTAFVVSVAVAGEVAVPLLDTGIHFDLLTASEFVALRPLADADGEALASLTISDAVSPDNETAADFVFVALSDMNTDGASLKL